jgi:hypothetical protein
MVTSSTKTAASVHPDELPGMVGVIETPAVSAAPVSVMITVGVTPVVGTRVGVTPIVGTSVGGGVVLVPQADRKKINDRQT